MFQIKNTTVNKDAEIVKDDITYSIHYVVNNNSLSAVQCVILQDSEGQPLQIGYIRKEHGRINTDFQEGYSLVEFMSVFEEIVIQIHTDIADNISTPATK